MKLETTVDFGPAIAVSGAYVSRIAPLELLLYHFCQECFAAEGADKLRHDSEKLKA
ncbi:hypothetical protein KIN20_005396 [Parelaphostrongylus tenuis]|uniref:Uncharacterized protein n=1 Tax=Parelaphostrongylus tenuis TaxID=148309 RepID=A0AAD5QF44_PARTN|nr:hypothetical protein KIN20_005396 [Parelaphostrongylus tenuis]